MVSKQGNLGDRAVVIGGSIAGLLSARVLSDFFTEILVIDKDVLPSEAQARSGVPQSLQPHVLLTKGYQIICQLFPKIASKLQQQGALAIDWGKEFYCFSETDWLANTPENSGIASVTCSRPLLETTIRQQLQENPKVRFLDRQRVTGLLYEVDKQQVTGVQTKRDRRDQTTPIRADLVVDCSGRNSQAPQWLRDIGIVPPPETKINAQLGYATRRYKKPPNYDSDWKVMLINHVPPKQTRLGYLAKIENGEWIATLGGYLQDFPPLNDAGFLDFARSLPNPEFYKAIASAEPTSPIYAYRATANRLRHYEKIQIPNGFITLGDAVCAFCPVYGQGMTVSALSAMVLQKWLKQAQKSWFSTKLSSIKFQKALSASNKFPWDFATGQDTRFLSADQPQPLGARLLQSYLNRLQAQATLDPEVYLSFLRIAHSLKSPLSFFAPALMWKVYFSEKN